MHADIAARIAGRYLALADRLLPDRILGFYLVGSTALGAYRHGRSDIDFVAVADRRLTDAELRRVRAVQVASGIRSTARALVQGHIALPGTVNGSYVAADDLRLPVTAIRPIASHVGHSFARGQAFDVNPVVWKELAEHGVALRGATPATLGLDPQPEILRQWNLENLNRYWQSWADAWRSGREARVRPLPTGWLVAWGVSGAPRLHHTIATGEVISKEAACEYAMATFDRAWHPTIEDGLAFLRFEALASKRSRSQRIADAAAFVAEVVRSANELAP